MTTKNTINLTVNASVARLDQYLNEVIPELSRSQLQKLIRRGEVQINGKRCKPSTALQVGNHITVHLETTSNKALIPEAIPLTVVYEDAHLVVINKPVGMVVHPAPGHETGTLVHALLARYPDLAALNILAPQRLGIVHRLDQDTSGLLVVARTAEALRNLQQQFQARTVKKTYLALVYGHPPVPAGLIDVPLGRDQRYRQRIAPQPNGKEARTHYRTRQTFAEYSLLEIDLETGRTHQIRVHLAWLKCPVVADTVYGRKKNRLGLKRQFLHAWRLGFEHPHTKKSLQFEIGLDETLQTVLEQLI
ncbi:RluA family pseudouridine synthase [Anaerolineales bacterium HSG24]|nr:RluA family pseudouridine synthase [Anaerolineales bacterium HSG24]